MSGGVAFLLLFGLLLAFIFVVWVAIPWAQNQLRKPRRRNTTAATPQPTLSTKEVTRILSEKPTSATVLTTGQWKAALDEAPHLLIWGSSFAGKSVLAQAVVGMLGDVDYVVIDPLPNTPDKPPKWGGIDFVTANETGDEYASIKAALARIQDEDTRRRRNMRTATPRNLVVIIDEALLLVDALGATVNEDGKKEFVISQFIRKMGASARHRKIKIIILAQGKNLVDLGLSSGTARNNYAQVQVTRNPATNERHAYIVHEDGNQEIDTRHVLALASNAAAGARLWLSQNDLAPDTKAELEALLHTDMAALAMPDRAACIPNTATSMRAIPDIEAVYRDMPQHTDMTERDLAILAILRANPSASKNAIFAVVGGDRNAVLVRIDELKTMAQV